MQTEQKTTAIYPDRLFFHVLFWLIPCIALMPSLASAQSAQQEKPSASPSAAGTSFQDCPNCPEMVVVPAGSFTMGAPPAESGGETGERPHKVTIAKPFAIGKYEITFDEWDACVADGDCKHNPDDEKWGRGKRPVIHVSWRNTKQFLGWLKRKTGVAYRLPSESEWEYAARAGTETTRYWGNDSSQACKYANVYDLSSKEVISYTWPVHQCNDSFVHTAPVGSFAPNAFGLYDMMGNVWEWVEDCWEYGYGRGPNDAQPRHGGECDKRVARGGSWSFDPLNVRSAVRYWLDDTEDPNDVGFRVVRAVNP